jgi:hypothetical protein
MILRVLFALLLGLSVAQAQSPIPLTGAGAWRSAPNAAPPAGYTGPGDVVSSAAGWWGARCYSAAYSGNVADITDASTGNTIGTRLQCSNGVVSALVSGSACTFVTGNTCSTLATTCASSCNVTTLYDQSGNGHNAVQATNSNRPTWIINCLGSLPCMNFAGQFLQVSSTSLGNISQPWTISGVGERTVTSGFMNLYGDGSGNGYGILWNSGANSVATWGGAILAGTANDNAFHAIQAIGNGGASVAYIDGTSNAGAAGTNALTGVGSQIANGFGALNTGRIAETGVWASGFSAGNQSSMNSNQHTYWGF